MDKIFDDKIIRQIVRASINQYAYLLIQDFKLNPEYSKLAGELLLSSFDTSEWVKNLNITDFGVVSYQGKQFERSFFKLDKIDKINFSPRKVKIIKEERYFFTQLQFKSLEDLHDNESGFYYIHEKDLIGKIDLLLFDSIKDFTKRKGTRFIYSKQISENVFLNFDSNKKRNNFSSIDRYFFPDLSIEINGVNYKFSNDTDLNTLLLIQGQAYFTFYTNSHEFIKDSNGEIVQVIRKEDEPVTYKSDNLEGYYLANSPENVARYNKFIYFTIELFIHYFRIFEKWVTSILLPNLLTSAPVGAHTNNK